MNTTTIFTNETAHPNDSIVANAQNVFGKLYALIPVNEIDIDYNYQRKQITANIRKLAMEWNDEFYDPIKVTYRENRFKAFDGGHRFLAQKMNGRAQVICQICPEATLRSEAYRFIHQMDNVHRIRPIDTLNANIVLEDTVDTAMVYICNKFNIAIPTSGSSNKAKELGSITEARRILRSNGGECFEWICEVITESKWDMLPLGYSAFILRVLKNLYVNYKDKNEEVKNALIYYFTIDPTMSPRTLRNISASRRPDLDYRSAAYIFLDKEIKNALYLKEKRPTKLHTA